jgi:hypothetical protein
VQPLLRIEDVSETQQVSLVGTPPVMEDQDAVRLLRSRALLVDQRLDTPTLAPSEPDLVS